LRFLSILTSRDLSLSAYTLLFILIGILFVVLLVLFCMPIRSGSSAPPPEPGVGYIVLCGRSSQPYPTHARQYLNLLFQKGVPAFRVRGFLPEGDFPPGFTSPHVGLPPLVVPAEYANCPGCIINACDESAIWLLAEALQDFGDNPLITRIVFVYDGNGDGKSLSFPNNSSITVYKMANYCSLARKPLLVVLDACYSTVFAERTIRKLTRLGDLDRVDVSFLTSGRGPCFNSAVVLSSETPHLFPAWCGVSYKINNSMFSRAFLFKLAYKLTAQCDLTLGNLPGRMNVPDAEMKNGFEAAAQYSKLANQYVPLREFFPWGPVGTDEKSSVNPDVSFSAVIPNREVGQLFDDIGNFWHDRGSQAGYEFLFCNVSLYDGAVRVKLARPLSDSDPQQRAVLEQLKVYSRVPRPEPPRKTRPVQVPFESIAEVVRAQLPEGRWARFGLPSVREWSEDLHAFVVNLNGKFPYGYSHDIWEICELSWRMDRGLVKNMIVEARNQVAKRLNIELEPSEQ
jgi:hypothetical protein